ncbi:hypothetical protein N1851_013314 [Merluccius polli]|uniref:Myb/SANT-like DNA-binding domain-containing protein n=1 Tax=Merluccius polli TaxID=89951 RepID=A0AA47P4F4_MERPO|nr:hypothetical protein N1851_013314 [Merluccius polli]
MTTDRKRSTYFNTLELEVLMLAYADYEHIFRRKSNTAAAAKEREAAWEKIAARVNAKKAEARKTGGGPPKPPLTEAEELALSQNRAPLVKKRFPRACLYPVADPCLPDYPPVPVPCCRPLPA